MAQAGIYEIVNRVNGKRYIGSAKVLPTRYGQHWARLRSRRHYNRKLQNSWNKHGGVNFEFRVLLVCGAEQLLFFEQRAIDALKPEYNLSPTAGSTLGVILSDETKAKISQRALGRKRDPESVERGASKRRGVKLSPEHIAHLIGNNHALGSRHTEEWRRAFRIRQSGALSKLLRSVD